ncbi:DMT family transporter [Marinihelvus fidelis]|uniref:DMT family transporter n=1 Tax=Marinihelvus fidelis TaxID=2613842 RepID=A0A5N0T6Y1_9GAMM|nr:DMT family transporter [Marinihelvus fidelis]KAA9130551.1 DMT family transporter [Marinihelvus fidelis]
MGWGEFYSLASPMVWALAVVLFRRSGETLPPVELNLCKNGIAIALMLPTVLIWGGLQPPAMTGWEWLLVLGSGALGMALGDWFYFEAINRLGAGRGGIIGSLLSPFVIVLSAVFLGERLAGLQWLGFALVMAGIVMVTWRRRRREVTGDDLRAGVIFGVLAIFLFALAIVMVKPVLEQHEFTWIVLLRLLAGLAGMLLIAGWRSGARRTLARFRGPQPWATVIWACVLGGWLSMVLWLAGYKLIPASEASIYNEAQGAFIVLFAWWILKEPVTTRKLVGLGLTLAGVVTMLMA